MPCWNAEGTMKTRLLTEAIVIFCLVAAIVVTRPRTPVKAASQDAATGGAVLVNTCLVTNNIAGLTTFYRHVLQIEPRKEDDSYVEFRTERGVLALFTAEAQEKYIPQSAKAAQNRSAILEFRVSDPDHEYARLHDFVKWVKGPTTQPWGTRSIYFRDPDGNLVDFFAPARMK
jgi:catechol 2,3-dioxygenase-like lactoylglutathione lyase family enzyme